MERDSQIREYIKEENNRIEYEINNIRQNMSMGNLNMNNMGGMGGIGGMGSMGYYGGIGGMGGMDGALFSNFNNFNYPNMTNSPINKSEEYYKITFDASTGNKTIIEIEETKTIEELLRQYINKIIFPEELIGKHIIFIYNGNKLDFHSKETVGAKFRNSNVNITVFDMSNSIGLYYKFTFEASSGNKTIIEIEKTKTIEDLLRKYIKKLDIPEESVGKDIIFLFNGDKLDFNSKTPLGEKFRNSNVIITVFEQINLIGLYYKITFNASSGKRTIIEIERTKTIEDLLRKYIKKLDIPEESVGKDIMFLYNGAQLDFRSKTPLQSLLRSNSVITVYDLNDIIGKQSN